MACKLFLQLVLLVFAALSVQCAIIQNKPLTYDEARNYVIQEEESMSLGSSVYLNPKEKQVDQLIKDLKRKDFENGIKDPINYAPGLHFFKAKPIIEKSEIFKIIKKMPKGGNLHMHNSASVSSEWIVKNLTYRDDVRLCSNTKGVKIFHFKHQVKGCADESKLIVILRKEHADAQVFDKELDSYLNLYTKQPEIDYPDINTVWKKFQNSFATVGGFLNYLPTFKDFHYQIMQELYDDNIMYAELRTSIKTLVDADGKEYSPRETLLIFIDLVEQFKTEHPGFLGVKIIFAVHRYTKLDDLKTKLIKFQEFRKEFPDYLVGFDLVGQEDTGTDLKVFAETLKDVSQNGKYFFHAGETNWFGTNTDYNLIDAIFLDSTRIGHGYSLYKHPLLWEAVKAKDIAIEISPISNQVLHLVQDLRNHPASFYFAENIPIVICSDDGGFWGSKGLSYDFYYAFMAFTPENAGLKVLKQLALNSIKYSAMSHEEKKNAKAVFKEKWDEFINIVVQGNI